MDRRMDTGPAVPSALSQGGQSEPTAGVSEVHVGRPALFPQVELPFTRKTDCASSKGISDAEKGIWRAR